MTKEVITIRKMFLDELPKRGNTEQISWQESLGNIINFIYDDTKGYLKLVDYNSNKNKLKVEYNNNLFDITTNYFKKCKIARILNIRTSDFKIEIGTRFKDDKRDLIVIDRKIVPRYNKKGIFKCNYKMYNYICKKCNYNGWIEESHLFQMGQGCGYCNGNCIVKEGINDVPTVAPWMIQYFQGGYDEAKLYSYGSAKKIYPICPDCGRIKKNKMSINSIYKQHNIGCICSDNLYYPEKFTFDIMEQLKIEFLTQLSKVNLKWCDKYRYDFYFEYKDEQYICEVNGIQHYEECSRGRSLQKEQENDIIKKELALANGIKEENYIIVDCRYSNLEWIREHILESRLAELFNLSNINWNKAEEFALSNLVKVACDYWNKNLDMSVENISKSIGCSINTTISYLKKGSKYKWCNYNSKEEQKKHREKNGDKHGKPVEIFKDGISLGVFKSATELERQSEQLFGIKLTGSAISKVCRGELKQHKGYTFDYIKIN